MSIRVKHTALRDKLLVGELCMSIDYATIRIPKQLADEMDALIGNYGFTSRAEIAKEAIRRLLQEYAVKKEA